MKCILSLLGLLLVSACGSDSNAGGAGTNGASAGSAGMNGVGVGTGGTAGTESYGSMHEGNFWLGLTSIDGQVITDSLPGLNTFDPDVGVSSSSNF